jgi:acyl-coenzyme A thioesterase PaaI-like protein
VVFIGRGLEGWPNIVHGGALATVLDENMGRAAVRTFPERTGVTANLQVNYRAPAWSDNFFELHTTVDQGQSTDRKAYVNSEVRDHTGTVCAEATGVFVVPKKLKLQTIGEKY